MSKSDPTALSWFIRSDPGERQSADPLQYGEPVIERVNHSERQDPGFSTQELEESGTEVQIFDASGQPTLRFYPRQDLKVSHLCSHHTTENWPR